MRRFIRFQTELRSTHKGSPLGVFCATVALEEQFDLPDYAQELLRESLDWFNSNLVAPRLPAQYARCVFWFRTEAEELLEHVWPLVALLNQEGLYVHQRTTSQPGKIVYFDEYQVAAVPGRR